MEVVSPTVIDWWNGAILEAPLYQSKPRLFLFSL